jgi:hypothetical protein
VRNQPRFEGHVEQRSSLQQVWNQTKLPVLLRGGRIRPLVIRLPYAADNRGWLRDAHRTKPEWLPAHKVWGIPKSWFDDVIRRALSRYGAVYVIQPFSKVEKCAPACWNALGAHCECSCMGANHGSGKPTGKWHIVSDTFAVRINGREYSCRLLHPMS